MRFARSRSTPSDPAGHLPHKGGISMSPMSPSERGMSAKADRGSIFSPIPLIGGVAGCLAKPNRRQCQTPPPASAKRRKAPGWSQKANGFLGEQGCQFRCGAMWTLRPTSCIQNKLYFVPVEPNPLVPRAVSESASQTSISNGRE